MTYATQDRVIDESGIGFVVLTAGAKFVEMKASLFEAMGSVFEEAVKDEAMGTSGACICWYLQRDR